MNKTAVVTGAARGIGADIAITLAKSGFDILLVYKENEEKCRAVEHKIKENGGYALLCQADISTKQGTDKVINTVNDIFGGAYLLVNNAGIAGQKLFCDITEEEWDMMFNVSVKAAYRLSKGLLPYMISNKRGKIINISSIWGIKGASCEVHYSAAKAAVIGFTKALAKEVGPSGITVNCVAPGVIDTDMNKKIDPDILKELAEETSMYRLGTPSDVAAAVDFLASDKASYITGQVITVDGGFI